LNFVIKADICLLLLSPNGLDSAIAVVTFRLSAAHYLNVLLSPLSRATPRTPAAEGICCVAKRTKMVTDFWQELRYGARMLVKNSGFSFIAIIMLAAGIGANTAVLTVVNAVLLKPMRGRTTG
jgi:hypothetical protein